MATDRGRRAVAPFVVVAVLATLVFESDVFVRRLADRHAGDVGGGCVSLDGLRVDLGTFPVGLRALAGRLDVRARADRAVLGDLRLGDIDARARGVRSSLFGGVAEVRVGHATVPATLAGADLARYLRAAGVPSLSAVLT